MKKIFAKTLNPPLSPPATDEGPITTPLIIQVSASNQKKKIPVAGEQSCKISHQKSTSWEGNHTATLSRLKLENERLHREVENLQRQLTAKRKSGGANSSSDTAGEVFYY